MTQVHRIRCSEIWGGNRGDELFVETSGVRACLYSRACDGGKGGDIYYFSVCGSDLLTRIAIVDVMGHGEAVSDTSSWLYDSLAKRMDSADGNEVLADLNRASAERGYESMSTATVAAFYRANSQLYFSYAGHHELLYLKKGSTNWQSLIIEGSDELEGLPLGVDADCIFHQKGNSATVGDRLFLYTDGVIEAVNENDKQFGTNRLIALLNRVADKDLTTIRQTVINSVKEHTGGSLNHDDITFMVVEFIESEDEY